MWPASCLPADNTPSSSLNNLYPRTLYVNKLFYYKAICIPQPSQPSPNLKKPAIKGTSERFTSVGAEANLTKNVIPCRFRATIKADIGKALTFNKADKISFWGLS